MSNNQMALTPFSIIIISPPGFRPTNIRDIIVKALTDAFGTDAQVEALPNPEVLSTVSAETYYGWIPPSGQNASFGVKIIYTPINNNAYGSL